MERVKGPANYMALLVDRARMQGFVVFDYMPRYAEAALEIARWMYEGKLKSREDVVEGIERSGERDGEVERAAVGDAARGLLVAALLRARMDELLSAMTATVRAFTGTRWQVRTAQATWSSRVATSGELLRIAQDALERDASLANAA